MNIKFLTSSKGKIIAVQLPLKDWKALKHKTDAYDLAASIRTGLKEMELIETKKLNPKSLEELLNDL